MNVLVIFFFFLCNSCATSSAQQKYKNLSKHLNCQFSSAPSTIVCQKSTFQTTKTLFSKAPHNHSVSKRWPTNGISWKKLHSSFFFILFVTVEYCETQIHFHWRFPLPLISRSCHFHIWDKGSLLHHFTTLLFSSGRAPDGLWPGSAIFDHQGYPSVFVQMPELNL